MFKYGYDYCSSVWTAPYGIPEQVFFSYLDIAHYEKYLPETIYVNLLYVVMGYRPILSQIDGFLPRLLRVPTQTRVRRRIQLAAEEDHESTNGTLQWAVIHANSAHHC